MRQYAIFLAATLTFGQTDSGKPRLPFWPGEADLPEGQYVFMSRDRHSLVVRVPAEKGGQLGGRMKTVIVPLHNRFQPSVTVKITPISARRAIQYEYSLCNGSDAEDPIEVFQIVVPSILERFPVQHAATPNWTGVWTNHTIDLQDQMPGEPTGGLAVWMQHDPAKAVGPGERLDRFRIESRLLPGFTTAALSRFSLRFAEQID